MGLGTYAAPATDGSRELWGSTLIWHRIETRARGRAHRASSKRMCQKTERLESAGINRPGERNERVQHRRRSESRWPRPCVGDPRGRSEALVSGYVQAGLLSREIKGFGVPTSLSEAEGNIVGRAIASGRRTPRGRRTWACAESPGARTGRSRGCPSLSMMPRPGWFAGWHISRRAGREGNAEAVSPR